MVHLYHDDEAQLELLQEKQIAVLGYGSQGHAHALNLRDNGCNVLVGLPRESKRKATAEAAGFQVLTTAEAAQEADLIALLIPDELHHTVFERDILPGLSAGKTLLTAHGFSLHYGQITPPEDIDVIMVAPNGPGTMLRKLFVEGLSTLGLWAVYPGCKRTCRGDCPGLRPRHRLHARRGNAYHVSRRNRNRSL